MEHERCALGDSLAARKVSEIKATRRLELRIVRNQLHGPDMVARLEVARDYWADRDPSRSPRYVAALYNCVVGVGQRAIDASAAARATPQPKLMRIEDKWNSEPTGGAANRA
jgi:hypothetical protein